MHPVLAYIVCTFNILIPGFGTILAGFFTLCGIANSGLSETPACKTFLLNLRIGVLQLLLVAFCLAGWIWSITWGLQIVQMSKHYGKSPSTTVAVTTTFNKDDDNKGELSLKYEVTSQEN